MTNPIGRMFEAMSNPQKYFSRSQSRLVDRLAIASGTRGIDLMENAAAGCVDQLVQRQVENALILSGTGNNGGDGFAMARMLANRGTKVTVLACGDPTRLTGDALINFNRLSDDQAELTLLDHSRLDFGSINGSIFGSIDGGGPFDWVVDAILGTGAKGDPRPPFDQFVTAINSYNANVMAVDIPSGLDCDTGVPGNPTVRADVTCTFVTQKIGFKNAAAKEFLGQVEVIDIGVSQKIVEQIETENLKGNIEESQLGNQ